MSDDFEPWNLPHMQNRANDAGLIQYEGFGFVRDGRHEMACVAPEPEPSLWQRLWAWLMSPDFGGVSPESIKEYVQLEHECKQRRYWK